MAPHLIDLDTLPFIGATYRRPRPAGVVADIIVLHDGETDEGHTAAEGMARYFARPAPRPNPRDVGSAHICVDDDSIVRCALDTERTNGAGGMNTTGLHLEQAGRAGQSSSQWADDYSRKVIANAAAVCVAWMKRYPHIRAKFLAAAELRRGERNGITTHREVTLAGFAGNDGHTDPGAFYPIATFMAALGTHLIQSALSEGETMIHLTIDGDPHDPKKANTSWYLAVPGHGIKAVSGSSVEKSTLARLAVAPDVYAWLRDEVCKPPA